MVPSDLEHSSCPALPPAWTWTPDAALSPGLFSSVSLAPHSQSPGWTLGLAHPLAVSGAVDGAGYQLLTLPIWTRACGMVPLSVRAGLTPASPAAPGLLAFSEQPAALAAPWQPPCVASSSNTLQLRHFLSQMVSKYSVTHQWTAIPEPILPHLACFWFAYGQTGDRIWSSAGVWVLKVGKES